MTPRVIEGPYGRGEEIDWRPSDVPAEFPEKAATLGGWILTVPGAHPLWSQYTLACVHLRPIAGQTKVVTLRSLKATHEFLVIALNPELPTVTAANWRETLRNPRAHLRPLNVVEQIEGATDAQAKEVLDLCARAVCDGYLHPEPEGVIGARHRWRVALGLTLEHIQTGGHAADCGGRR